MATTSSAGDDRRVIRGDVLASLRPVRSVSRFDAQDLGDRLGRVLQARTWDTRWPTESTFGHISEDADGGRSPHRPGDGRLQVYEGRQIGSAVALAMEPRNILEGDDRVAIFVTMIPVMQ